MEKSALETNQAREELDRVLWQKWISGLWNVNPADRPLHPRTAVKPHLWKWDDIYQGLLQARDQISIERGSAERRTLRLVNPGLQERQWTSHTMMFSCQMLQPGETAPPHRHTMAAIRFILKGRGAYTVVEGQKIPMEEGDLILTPQWTWHEHGSESQQPMIWLDGLDVPLIESLNVISFEPYPGQHHPLKGKSYAHSHYGLARPVAHPSEALPAPYHYPWRETYPSLKLLAERDPHPFEGVALEYVNPITGGPTLPTVSCWIQMLRGGERTRVHRHTSTSLYHVFRGKGTTVVNGEAMHWEQGDSFVVPLWHWHEHANRATNEEAILFSMHDRPVLEAFGLYREEADGESKLGL